VAELRQAGFEEFVAGRGQALQRFGYLVTGDWALAEDLLQAALARTYPRWTRIESPDPEAYVRKVMVNTWSSWRRRRWRDEVPSERLPEFAAWRDEYQDADRRQAARIALAALPSRQRLVIVLRFHQDLSEQQVAELLGISVGTVKSQTARGLARLRADGALDNYRNAPAGGD
jgi:RNA polymerase sigma-70 factor (sigma-E family)